MNDFWNYGPKNNVCGLVINVMALRCTLEVWCWFKCHISFCGWDWLEPIANFPNMWPGSLRPLSSSAVNLDAASVLSTLSVVGSAARRLGPCDSNCKQIAFTNWKPVKFALAVLPFQAYRIGVISDKSAAATYLYDDHLQSWRSLLESLIVDICKIIVLYFVPLYCLARQFPRYDKC